MMWAARIINTAKYVCTEYLGEDLAELVGVVGGLYCSQAGRCMSWQGSLRAARSFTVHVGTIAPK